MTLPFDIVAALDFAARHLRDADIAQYIDNSLTGEERRCVENHLQACPACRAQTATVREAVESDIVNPARLNAAVARLVAASKPVSKPFVAVSNDFNQAAERLVRTASQRALEWVGSLSTWSPQHAVAGAPLAEGARGVINYAGVQARVEGLFSPVILRQRLAWATGCLSLAAAYDEAGRIRTIRAVVDTRNTRRSGSAIMVKIGTITKDQVILRLTQDRPSDVRAASHVEGTLRDLIVAVSLGEIE